MGLAIGGAGDGPEGLRDADPGGDVGFVIEAGGDAHTWLDEGSEVVVAILLHRAIDRDLDRGEVRAASRRRKSLEPAADRGHLLGRRDGALRGPAAGRGLVVEPELDVGLQGVEPDGAFEAPCRQRTRPVEMVVGIAATTGAIGDLGSLGLGVSPIHVVAGIFADACPALERQAHLADDGSQLAERAIDGDPLDRAGLEPVADRGEESQVVTAQESPTG
ncbi:MAG: hypothetical protein A2V84_09740 [Chloroflexi bacterium RBG_16_70_13]|nr:MAG: hypothetical protein A2V84_09740 [Chloroflexi bacterium RBG_16_70_13]